ncbi:TetR/AcrR family transcriptional regulator [Prauserella cavernicola]|uniref:TetR/AcrR family transcriptional regulator n=1 Tax=Prauserella cavernicola TaxID=2800127 RepID=A0A934V1I3_9PSEU|nr:TetR/AcrR family transcriptional regulator [Prauserella cavernicola]MBK1783086.1 TetR/AcrR family transcriptional regulator [Prauserella cavernicola]
MTSAKRPDASRRNEKSRQAILTATRELIAETGYAKVSIEAIAARAGVGKQTIYRWWSSKGAVVFDSILDLSGPVDDAVVLPDTGDLETDLKQVLRATVAEFADAAFEAPIRALTVEIATDPELAALYQRSMATPMDEAKKARLRSAQEAGQLSPDADLDLVLSLLNSPVFERWLMRGGPLDDAFADGVVEAVVRAFSPGP